MRYIRTKTVVTKLYDGMIEDEEEKSHIIDQLYKNEISINLQLNEGPIYRNIKIIKYDASTRNFKWRMTGHESTLNKSSNVSEIQKLEVNTESETIITKKNVSRWALIDPAVT